MAAMAHGTKVNSCFPTGLPYPGIMPFLRTAPPAQLGLAEELDPDAPWHTLPLAAIDTETTGRDPGRGDRIVEIAVVHFRDGVVEGRYGMLVNPGIPIPADAAAVHGITDAQVKGQPTFEQLAPKILELLQGRIPLAYNAGFDRGFIRAELARAGVEVTKTAATPPAMRGTEWLDPLVWARALQTGVKGFKLGEVSTRLGVDLSNAHRATDDAEAAGMVLYKLLPKERGTTYRSLVLEQRGLKSGPAGRTWRR